MPKYVQLTPDLARAAIDAGKSRDLLIALEYVGLADRVDAPYGVVRNAFTRLAEAGIELDIEDLIGRSLADRERTNRKRNKSAQIAEKCHGTKIREEKEMKKQREENRTEENEFSRFIPAVKSEVA